MKPDPRGRVRRFARIALAGIIAGAAGCRDVDPPAAEHPAARAEIETSPREGRVVAVYFTVGERPRAVHRAVADGADPLAAAVEQLLRGPTAAEADSGITSFFSERTAGMLRGAGVDAEGHATIDFADLRPVIPNASTSAGSTILLAEIDSTVFQFEHVRSVRYRIDGDCEAFWNWLQRGCQEVRRAAR